MSRDHENERVTYEAARTEQAKTRAEQATTGATQAATDSEQANTRTAQAETQSAQARTRLEQAETQAEQDKTRKTQAATQTQQTNTKTMEQALRTSELSYRRLFEAAQDGILILDVDTGRITDVNPFVVKLLGYSHAEMVGKTVGELSPFHDIVNNQAMLERVQKHGYVRYEDLPLKTKDRRHIAVEFVSNVYQAGDKKVIQCNIRDITNRKQAEATSNLLRAIVESSDDAIIGKDLNGNVTSWNRGAEKIFGYLAGEIMGTSILRIIPAQRAGEEDYILARIRLGERVEHFETQRQTKAGKLIDVSVSISPIRDFTGTVIGVSKVARDITERRKMELRFQQAQKMESIGLLAGGIAHDFNNILAAITGGLYLAKLESTNNPSVLEYLDDISQASQRAADLINQILTFSRQNKPDREAVKLNHVVLEALKLLRASLPSTIRIQTELTETPSVLANATAIHQVMMNLGTNAWHAMREQLGTLKVEMSVIEADPDFAGIHPDLQPGRYVRLSVSDTGCGMDRATQEHIFEPFFTTKGAGEGTGLGLAVVDGIMKSHDGCVSVCSQPGEGATFHLYFPVIETDLVTETIEPTPIPQGRGEHILFVDDEAALAGLGKKILERLGYVVTIKTSPSEAITAVRDHPGEFDLVITDLTMPGMDGAKLGAQLLLLEPCLRIIITTGYSGVLTPDKARALGFQEILSKPSSARILGETVHRVLRRTAATET